MPTLTFKQAERLFRKHWGIITEDGGSYKRYGKEDALIKVGFFDRLYPRNSCFACEYIAQDCSNCPVDWPGGHCFVETSPFYLWQKSKTKKDRQKYAEIIRNLTWTDKKNKGGK